MKAFDLRLLEVERILDELRLVKPAAKSQDVIPLVKDVTSILGSWKAYSSRMRLRGDRTIAIATGVPFRFITKDRDQQHVETDLIGRFRTRDDELFSEWGITANATTGGDYTATDC